MTPLLMKTALPAMQDTKDRSKEACAGGAVDILGLAWGTRGILEHRVSGAYAL